MRFKNIQNFFYLWILQTIFFVAIIILRMTKKELNCFEVIFNWDGRLFYLG